MRIKKIKRVLELNLKHHLLRLTPVLVYSMERSGSVALLNTLENAGVFVIGAHYLDPKKLATQPFSGSARWAATHIIRKRKPAKIISLVRHPIENMLSTYARTDYGSQSDRSLDASPESSRGHSDEVSREFCEAYLQANRHLHLLEWFTNEFQSALGVNVYDYPFDKQKGFAEFRAGPYDVLILRTELPDSDKAGLVASFAGIEGIEMASRSAPSKVRRRLPPGKPGHQTEYAEKYKALQESVVFPQSYLDSIVDSQYVQHFFTSEEQSAMRSRFGGGIKQES